MRLPVIIACVVVATALPVYYFTESQSEDLPIPSESVYVAIYSVSIFTDKQVYEIGEPVKYTIKNTGREIASFGNIALNSHIEDSTGKWVYSPPRGERMIYVQPDQEHTFTWETAGLGKQALGEYTAISKIMGNTIISATFVLE